MTVAYRRALLSIHLYRLVRGYDYTRGRALYTFRLYRLFYSGDRLPIVVFVVVLLIVSLYRRFYYI